MDHDSRSTAPRFDPSSTIAHNFRPLSHHELNGFGGMGKGMSVHIAPDGRCILWLAHENAPKNFTGVDVSDSSPTVFPRRFSSTPRSWYFRPGRTKGIVPIDLPYPRDIGMLSSDRLGVYATHVRALMQDSAPAARVGERGAVFVAA